MADMDVSAFSATTDIDVKCSSTSGDIPWGVTKITGGVVHRRGGFWKDGDFAHFLGGGF